jgi:hypothetical protein
MRVLLVASLVLLTVLGAVWWCAQAQRAEAAQWYEEAYDQIKPGMPEFRLERAFGRPGQLLVVPGWPRKLGEIAGYETGLPMEFKLTGASDGFKYVVPPDQKVWWLLWRTTGDRWIAVCFINDGSGGSLTEPCVIAKRRGRGDPASGKPW